MNLNKQNLINKILYRSQYRGTKEMDKFVSSFVNSLIYHLSFNELKDLDKLIDLNDEDIIRIYNNQNLTNINPKIIEKLRGFKLN